MNDCPIITGKHYSATYLSRPQLWNKAEFFLNDSQTLVDTVCAHSIKTSLRLMGSVGIVVRAVISVGSVSTGWAHG